MYGTVIHSKEAIDETGISKPSRQTGRERIK
jgi:hypothetical protein